MFKKPAASFVDVVKQHPELRAWQLVELVQADTTSALKAEEPKAEEPKAEEKKEVVVEPVNVEERKAEEKVFVKEITDDDMISSNLSKKESIPAPVVEKKEEPKPLVVESSKPLINKLNEKEVDYNVKQSILQELIDVCGHENNYVEFVRKNYKKGLDHCLNAWFDN